ncbi:hypothetical protein ACFQFC_07785 [Amorphoplanes digitatis]|uniref:Uncharacterized protein n=1 Tax=Actinoplanes digitatis TaxID=1868 RepID=A0A7W7I0K8_9ACTN|nr:hypothetical protein [Actinoplanes digitatis]MBB4764103.1 hypothetical protein [Actinoplanes digitatis]GID97381.1 hypothetical protein Adi01nite_67930 [Actinoplanes digitatis]
MQPFAPFTGVLVLPDRAVFGSTSPVTLGNGEQVATVRWHKWTARARFELLDAAGSAVLASGSRTGFWGRTYQVLDSRQEPVLDLRISGWGLSGRSVITLPGGRVLHAKGNWSARRFAVADEDGAPVARLVTTGSTFSLRPDSLALELTAPVLSIVQGAGLAQCLRAAAEAARDSSAAG